MNEEDAEIRRKLDALDEYARIMNLTPEEIERWQKESSEIRHSWVNPWDKV